MSHDPTDEYLQNVLSLAHDFPTSELAWEVSQSVLDLLWERQEREEQEKKINTASYLRGVSSAAAPKASTPASNASPTTITYACQGCGQDLYPGWNDTTLRVKRPRLPSNKKTLKRREQRKRRRDAQNETRNATAKSHNHRRKQQPTPKTQAPKTATAPCAPKRILLGDDPTLSRLDHHRLVLSCGRCSQKTYLKGCRRLRIPQKPESTSTSTVAPPKVSTSHGVQNLSQDFERLPDARPQKPSSSALSSLHSTKKQRPPPASVSLVEQKMGKKKKKKKTSTKSGNLMDFLSSLNTH